MEFLIFIVVILMGYGAYRLHKLGKFDRKPVSLESTQTVAFYPCVIEGNVSASPKEARVKALAIEAQTKGIVITGDYDKDVAAQGGEMTLLGTSFKLVVDSQGQIVASQSHLNLFLTDYPVQGGIKPDGTLAMAVNVGGAYPDITGRIVNGKLVDGLVTKGWLPHIYGVLNGTWTKT